MKAFFSRRVPFYVLAPEEVTDSIGFDAYPIETPEEVVAFAQKARRLVTVMEQTFINNPAPEECAQAEAALFEELVNG